MTQEYRSSWTDKRLDEFADSVHEVHESITELRESIAEQRRLNSETSANLTKTQKIVESNARAIEAMGNKYDPYLAAMMASQARMQENAERHEARMAQLEAEAQERRQVKDQRKAESYQRFNVLLAEVRYLIHGKNYVAE
jgi:chromosome segregation ATPase